MGAHQNRFRTAASLIAIEWRFTHDLVAIHPLQSLSLSRLPYYYSTTPFSLWHSQPGTAIPPPREGGGREGRGDPRAITTMFRNRIMYRRSCFETYLQQPFPPPCCLFLSASYCYLSLVFIRSWWQNIESKIAHDI